ncbi:MAG: 3-deoxy-manno-octulosonate cytidylyltransferase [Planctomycetota bacterium]|nr:MAG: 3-deoxy-manno-octulosonate cytidylyltransferase [Planctomycetota bacterium]
MRPDGGAWRTGSSSAPARTDEVPERLRAIAVIPARYASSRLPGKPLLAETGRPLIHHVVEQVRQARRLAAVLVATDDPRIARACAPLGIEAVMTPVDCPSGTDRVACVARARLSPDDLVINVQGDEPELPPAWIDTLIALMAEDDAPLGTLAARSHDAQSFHSPHAVKAVADARGRALYFSRAPIPYDRETGGMPRDGFLHHIGIYAYRQRALLALAGLPPSPLEQLERLEQLRALERGFAIRVGIVQGPVPGGIDTPEDYAAFVRRMRQARGASADSG